MMLALVIGNNLRCVATVARVLRGNKRYPSSDEAVAARKLPARLQLARGHAAAMQSSNIAFSHREEGASTSVQADESVFFLCHGHFAALPALDDTFSPPWWQTGPSAPSSQGRGGQVGRWASGQDPLFSLAIRHVHPAF